MHRTLLFSSSLLIFFFPNTFPQQMPSTGAIKSSIFQPTPMAAPPPDSEFVGPPCSDCRLDVSDWIMQHRAYRENFIIEMKHAVSCSLKENCPRPTCAKQKEIMEHLKECPLRVRDDCTLCVETTLSCFMHGMKCKDANCDIIYCKQIQTMLGPQASQPQA